MNYQTYQPSPNLASVVKCYWTLEVPPQNEVQKQLILPDGCVDMCFILGDDIKRYTNDTDFIIQPRQMLLGQITEPFFIEPTCSVDTFAVRFYPYGFANFIHIPLHELSNKETPLAQLFGTEKAERLSAEITHAKSTTERIGIIEEFLLSELFSESTINNLVKSTLEAMFMSNGSLSLNAILKNDLTKRRQIERNFQKQIGISPKQLSKVIRLQAALHRMLNKTAASLTDIAYESDYYDQNHFIKDFKEFTGITPKEFLKDEAMALSSLLYKKS